MNDVKISRIWWLWVPVAFLALDIVLEHVLSPHLVTWTMSEQGPIELSQSLCMFVALFVAISILRKLNPETQKWLMVWVGVAALACFYIAGEEISWGQQILHWQTPAEWAQVNDQDETNLHNTSSWFDQKPRMVLLVGIIIGGLIIPLVHRFKPSALPERFAAVYPSNVMGITALLTIIIKILNHIQHKEDIIFFERGSELQESYMFYFVFLYLVILRRSVMQNQG